MHFDDSVTSGVLAQFQSYKYTSDTRNGYLQTNILNFAVPKLVVDDISANETKTETGTGLGVAGEFLQKPVLGLQYCTLGGQLGQQP